MSESTTKAIDEKFCSECGAIIKAKAEICPKCGVRQMAKP
ncbi:MAG: zinc-ribbon domain-containing protein, partial [Zoogloeaceae bacterium]|nr:zinc-ribbon domain-containing protein [Zoogloeaceae bacterium]